MRKILFSGVMLLCAFLVRAQQSQTDPEVVVAKQIISKNAAALRLSAADISNSIITNTYKIRGQENLRMVYMQQSFKGIPVFNELRVLAFRNDVLVSDAGERLDAMDKRVNMTTVAPAFTAIDAVRQSIQNAGIKEKELAVPIMISADGHRLEFGRLGVATENITAELMWYPVQDNKHELRLAWQVFFAPATTSDMWLIRVDAVNGNILGRQNLTITCNWDDKKHSIAEHMAEKHTPSNYLPMLIARKAAADYQFRPFTITSATYRCIPYPFESPTHLGAPSTLTANAWTMAPGNATSLGWHNDGTADHDSTRGNNVWAAEDRAATNNVIDKAAVSLTPGPVLNFDYAPDYTVAPTTTTPPNQQFAITNLFYWNNIMHDISYLYGFDEVGGNFQNSNQGRGGLGNDYVIADAQDGGGTNNANFGTPVDGQRPRMQMYLWTAPNPDRDGDLDNGIVAHEYTHGISTRLTGGPANSSCLGNAEQGGEGWSDYFALMVTTNWATATVNDGFTVPRAMGTYALGQPVNGTGIRNFKYSTNMGVNPLVYSATMSSEVHNLGEYWCMALWEMTWEIIQQAGINPNLYNPAAGGGNAVALKLVTEGLRLQPCSPGFIDARNAILKADTLFFGAQYSCAIWRAFAKRGMGRGASQGSSNSTTDQVPSFIVDNGIFSVTESAPAVQEGQNVTYTNHVTAGNCSALSNAFVTDTLPTHVTYVSGGVYNPGNRTVTFGPVSLLTNQSQDYQFTVNVNNGSYFPPVQHFNETVASASIPASWTATTASATVWTTSNVFSNSGPNSFFAPDPPTSSDHQLATTATYALNPAPSAYTTLSFWHRFNTEDGWDGGVVEVSTDGGSTWADLGNKMILNGYNSSLGTGSALAGRAAFTGLINAFEKTVINLSAYGGQSIKIRFRFASDNNTAPTGGGWFVDDIVLYTEPAVAIRSNLFNSTNALLQRSDTLTRILPNATCTPATFSTQPSNTTTCAGNTAVFTGTAGGSAPITYQWQVNTGSGFSDLTNAAPYAGTASNTLTVSNVTGAMNTYQYRLVATNACSTVQSAAATLTVTAVASITGQPSSVSGCGGGNVSFTVAATGATAYQWQVNTGSGFTDISNGGVYSGATTATLTITGVTSAMNNYQYRAVLASCGPSVNSNAVTLTVTQQAAISSQTPGQIVCQDATATFTVTTIGTVTGYQWQVSTNGGASFTNISGQTTPTLTLPNVGVAMSNNIYRVVVSGTCNTQNSINATLIVNPRPQFTLGNIPGAVCISDPVVTLTSSGSVGTWSGTGVIGNQLNPAQGSVGPRQITFTSTNSFGCTSSQTLTIQVNECPERHVSLSNPNAIIVYPNPNNGQFSIRVKSDLYTRIGLRVYASDGKLVATQVLTGITYDKVVPMNLSKLSSGVYRLYMYNDENGKSVHMTFNLLIAR